MPGSTLPPSVRAGAVRPYPPAYGPFYWRDWWDFGASGLAHMGIYNLAPVFDALRPGPPLEWDPENHCIPNQPGADRYLHYEYRRFGHFEPVNRVVDRSTVRRQMSDRADLPEMPD